MASHGEYMLKASAVTEAGRTVSKFLNGGGNFRRLFGRYRGGGLISGADQGAGESASRGVRIINVIDPHLVRDYLGTSAGESAILNVSNETRFHKTDHSLEVFMATQISNGTTVPHATDYADLLSKLKTFALANGWTSY
jgi:hypothetical protein